MYNSTNNLRTISNTFNSKRAHLLLSDGLFISWDMGKTVGFGYVCFTLWVYLGKKLGVEKWWNSGDSLGRQSTAWPGLSRLQHNLMGCMLDNKMYKRRMRSH